jgi:hypothetical protein
MHPVWRAGACRFRQDIDRELDSLARDMFPDPISGVPGFPVAISPFRPICPA